MISISNLFEEVKSQITVDMFLQSIGHNVKHYNNRAKLLCLFHPEKTPSMVLFKNKKRVTCFGCGWSGDVIDVVAKYYNIPLLEAAQRLSRAYGIMPGESSPLDLDEISQYRKEKALIKALEFWREQQHIKLSTIYRVAHLAMKHGDIDAVPEVVLHWLPVIGDILDRLERGNKAEIAELWRHRMGWGFLG